MAMFVCHAGGHLASFVTRKTLGFLGEFEAIKLGEKKKKKHRTSSTTNKNQMLGVGGEWPKQEPPQVSGWGNIVVHADQDIGQKGQLLIWNVSKPLGRKVVQHSIPSPWRFGRNHETQA